MTIEKAHKLLVDNSVLEDYQVTFCPSEILTLRRNDGNTIFLKFYKNKELQECYFDNTRSWFLFDDFYVEKGFDTSLIFKTNGKTTGKIIVSSLDNTV